MTLINDWVHITLDIQCEVCARGFIWDEDGLTIDNPVSEYIELIQEAFNKKGWMLVEPRSYEMEKIAHARSRDYKMDTHEHIFICEHCCSEFGI